MAKQTALLCSRRAEQILPRQVTLIAQED